MRIFLTLLLAFSTLPCGAEPHWFEVFKREASDAELYRFLYNMPKGADLHNHLSGAGFPEWWLELALQQAANGYVYYTKVSIKNCRPYGNNDFGPAPYLLYFRNILEANYRELTECEKSEYVRLQDMNPEQTRAWLNSLRLDSKHEGRDEFFQTHWQRLGDLFFNHRIQAEILVRNMQAFSEEGVMYLEIDCTPVGMKPDGSYYTSEDVYQYYLERLARQDALDTQVTVRFHYALLRFAPGAETRLAEIYAFVDAHREMYVAIDMVGREDNDKGHPLRFLPTLRKLRAKYPDIELSIHAGEVDEPNAHIRNTLLLGANRIGHGVNLLSDPDTLLLMRHNMYLVEINLISNLLLEYVSDYSEHILPELLRIEVPVALSTDDRGMWDSNLTDEYFVAVKEFNLSWEELTILGGNSLQFSFVNEVAKAELLRRYKKETQSFVKRFRRRGVTGLQRLPLKYGGFICRYYGLCTKG